ncbi:hypothetical protein HNY73_002961 [Argiope bruennichi]|uniref:Uncharacterized protein n=1 Tax=Argiope bruennichi TaxID=94029 RepID=A0A8T0FZT4_ARGBR|nr:hypothetical protein HNY73_002961 [Argiope bruennichi]
MGLFILEVTEEEISIALTSDASTSCQQQTRMKKCHHLMSHYHFSAYPKEQAGDRNVYVKQRKRRLGGSRFPVASFSLPISKRSFPLFHPNCLLSPENDIFSAIPLPFQRETSLNTRNSAFAKKVGGLLPEVLTYFAR